MHCQRGSHTCYSNCWRRVEVTSRGYFMPDGKALDVDGDGTPPEGTECELWYRGLLGNAAYSNPRVHLNLPLWFKPEHVLSFQDDEPTSTPAMDSEGQQAMLRQMTELISTMGFDPDQVLSALMATAGDMAAALTRLVTDAPPEGITVPADAGVLADYCKSTIAFARMGFDPEASFKAVFSSNGDEDLVMMQLSMGLQVAVAGGSHSESD